MSATGTLLLQLIVILATARACSWLLRLLGQPSVVGEMAAGLILGPLCFGFFFPAWHSQVFAAQTLGGLSALSTLGLILFMFIVGLELRAPMGFGAQLKASGSVGVLSVVVPMALGAAIGPLLHASFAPKGVGVLPFSLFLAVALSITAFPVLARILKDLGLTQTRSGQLALSSAAVVDVIAWVLLAFVIGLTGADGGQGALTMLLGAALLVGFVHLLMRPLFRWVLRVYAPEGDPSPAALTALVIGLLLCAWLAEAIHLHAIFGAFLFGASLPRDDRVLDALSRRIEPLCLAVFIPIFFALAGLTTHANAMQSTGLGALALILVVAVVGKIGGGALGARLTGYGWRESLAIGSLMNARGLMELVVIKVGLDAGLITPELFTILFIMALVTSAMTTPLVTFFAGRPAKNVPHQTAAKTP